ncbi:MAG: hypothetical protein V4631_06940 [Pseudomonadota bacterium]
MPEGTSTLHRPCCESLLDIFGLLAAIIQLGKWCAAMSDALKTALALVEHTNAKTVRKVERRGDNSRRKSDLLEDECGFD